MTGLFQPFSIRSGVFAFVVGLIMLCGLPGAAQAACSAPAGVAGDVGYNSTAKTFQYCDGTDWVRMNKPGSGSGGCTNPALAEGQMGYNQDFRVLQGCAGNVHRAMGPVGGGGEWRQVDTGGDHTCGVKTDGTLWCWGTDGYSQLGNGAATGDQIIPVQESTAARNWASVSAGGRHTCAVKTNGTLWCWGYDNDGELGNGAAGGQISPMQESTAATNWATVSAGGHHTCATKTNGTLWCWGADYAGQLGNGAAGDQESPMQESTAATNWATVSVGLEYTCATKANGTLWCWGYDNDGELGNGATGIDQISPVQESTAAGNWASVSAGVSHTCAMKTDGMFYCWGDDSYGQLGNGATTGNQTSPAQESTVASNWASVSAGARHTCAVKTDGTLWCWGSDSNGQLGNGAAGGAVSPVQESTAATNWAAVSAGGYHTCAVKTDGTLWCWGSDSNGQLGNGAAGGAVSPVQESTAATNWAAVSAGGYHTCAVKATGTLWCWGFDGDGELGNGAATGDQVSPVQESTAASDWATVAGGLYHTCAVKTTGTLWCWGYDGYGQLGNGAGSANQVSPAQESTAASDWATVAAGLYHTCAVKATGTLWCWGSDSNGQLGNGAAGGAVSPAQESTAASDWAKVSAGANQTCAVKTDGTLYCWGDDLYGQLGNGATTGTQVSPVAIGPAWGGIEMGDKHSCAIGASPATLFCWGWNAFGQLGAGIAMGDSPVLSDVCATLNGKDYRSGNVFYNSDINILQYCDGAGWVGIGKESPDPCTGTPAAGTVCKDGSVYAGLSPDGNVPMFTTPADAGGFGWNNENAAGYVTTSQVSSTTGEANTMALIAIDSDSGTGGVQPHQAAQYCADLIAYGNTDWYLPAKNELNVLYTNRGAIGGFNTSGSWPLGLYWSSTENGNLDAIAQYFNNGVAGNSDKAVGLSVRCVRK